MSKTDWVSAAVTLIVTGIGYLIGGPKAAAACIGVGLVIMGFVHLWERKKATPLPEMAPLVGVRDSFNPSVTQNPIINVVLPPVPSVQPAAPVIPIKTRKEPPKHNVVFLGAEFINIFYSGPGYGSSTDGMQSFSESTSARSKPEDMIGVVVRFRNEAIYGQEIRPIRGARAHLKIFNKDSREVGTGFSCANWLGHSEDTFDLIPNGAGGSVLVCWGSNTEAHVEWKTRRGVRLHDNTLKLRDGWPSTAEVTLMDYNDRPLLPSIVLEITKPRSGGRPNVIARRPQ